MQILAPNLMRQDAFRTFDQPVEEQLPFSNSIL